jgi:arsenate reductase (glutaredoxin)
MASGSRETVIYHNPKCSTSRRTLDLLRDSGFEPAIIRYLKSPPSRSQRAKMIRDAGIDARTAVPKRTRLARPIDAVREFL